MSAEPRIALNALIVALERHLEACAAKRGEDDPTVEAAYEDVADAFLAYDDALLTAYDEMTPLDVFEDDDDDEDDVPVDDHDDEDGGDGSYAGLSDEDPEWSDDEE